MPYEEPTNIYTNNELVSIANLNTIACDIVIRGEYIKNLGEITKINGSLGFSESTIEKLGNLKEVTGNFWISSRTVYSNLTSLQKLEIIGGDLQLRYSNIKELGSLKRVGGKLTLRDTPIKSLGSLKYVGGDLYLPKRLENEIDISNIEVKGKVRFWNDSKSRIKAIPKNQLGLKTFDGHIPFWKHKYIHSFKEITECDLDQKHFYKQFKQHFLKGEYIDLKGNDNYSFILLYDLVENNSLEIDNLLRHFKNLEKYYPKTKGYTNTAIIQKLEYHKDFEKAWDFRRRNGYIPISTIVKYESRLQRQLVDGDLLSMLGGYTHLTDFGQDNIQEIKSYATTEIDKYVEDKGKPFFDLFLKDGKPLTENQEFYKDFFISESEYEFYKKIDDSQKGAKFHIGIPHIVEKAILNQFRVILKNAEDSYRESIGMPKVGEGWISETELFYKISNHFSEDDLIHHASPKWLGRQHLDIYFTEYKIAIEYQGAQHYEPIDFFGGQEAFEKTVERDERKKQLCEKNNCHLIYVEKGYDLNEVLYKISEIKTLHNSGNRCTTP